MLLSLYKRTGSEELGEDPRGQVLPDGPESAAAEAGGLPAAQDPCPRRNSRLRHHPGSAYYTATKKLFLYSFSENCAGLSPNFHIFGTTQVAPTMQRKFYFYPFLGIVRPQSQCPHSCVCERFTYIFPGAVHIFGCCKIDRSILEI